MVLNLPLFLIISSVAYSALTRSCGKGILESGLSAVEKKNALNEHNEFRLLIAQGKVKEQPKGINLKKMYWDDALAKAAQKIANTCVFAHVNVKDGRWSWVGQNLYMMMWSGQAGKGSDIATGIQSWFDENKNFVYPTTSNGATGHYTQVVWADSKYVGCGYTHFLNDQGQSRKLYVCNYGPGGNYEGKAPYKPGNSGCANLC